LDTLNIDFIVSDFTCLVTQKLHWLFIVLGLLHVHDLLLPESGRDRFRNPLKTKVICWLPDRKFGIQRVPDRCR